MGHIWNEENLVLNKREESEAGILKTAQTMEDKEMESMLTPHC